MKNNTRILMSILFFSLSAIILPTATLFAQNAKLKVYVWNFSVSNDSLSSYGDDFTNDFETELIKFEIYEVLDRRNLNRIMAKKDMEKNISKIENLSSESKNELKVKEADAVFFGDLKFDNSGGKYKLSVTLESLNGELLRKGSILIDKGEIYHPPSRKDKVELLFKSLHAKELSIAKKEQYEMIDKSLRRYRARVDEITKIYEDIGILLTENGSEYNKELIQKIEAYNEIWNDLNDNKAKYLRDFDSYWGKDRLRDFNELYSKIMDDFHERFIRKLDGLRTDINEYRTQQSSKKDKEIQKQNILKKTKDMTEDIRIELTRTITPQINMFLNKLAEDLSS